MLKPKKLIIIPIALVLILALNYSIKESEIYNGESIESFNQKELIASISEKNVFLYGIRKNNAESFNKIVVKIDNKEKIFDWASTWNLIGYPPSLTLTDLDNNGQQEVVIIITESFGSDIHLTSIHVLNINTLEEIPMDNPIEISKKIANTKIAGEFLNINIQNQTYKVRLIDFIDDLTSIWQDATIGNQVSYSIEGNNIVARLSVHIKPSVSVGNIKIIYQYKDQRLQVISITFEWNAL